MAVYHISFDTKAVPGKLKAVRIEISEEIITDMDRTLNVALAADPLYAEIERYVMANPSPKTPTTKH